MQLSHLFYIDFHMKCMPIQFDGLKLYKPIPIFLNLEWKIYLSICKFQFTIAEKSNILIYY